MSEGGHGDWISSQSHFSGVYLKMSLLLKTESLQTEDELDVAQIVTVTW